jgi:hypothetical protein
VRRALAAVLLAFCGCATAPKIVIEREPPGLPALADGVYSGRFIALFEMSWFTPCGTNYRWWLDNDGYQAVFRVARDHDYKRGKNFWVRVRGTPSATGHWGHLGDYSRNFHAREALEAHDYGPGDCDGKP